MIFVFFLNEIIFVSEFLMAEKLINRPVNDNFHKKFHPFKNFNLNFLFKFKEKMPFESIQFFDNIIQKICEYYFYIRSFWENGVFRLKPPFERNRPANK